MPYKKKIQYTSEEHDETVRTRLIRRERVRPDTTPVGELSLAEYENYLSLREDLVPLDTEYAKMFPRFNPTKQHLTLLSELYDSNSDLLFK